MTFVLFVICFTLHCIFSS